VGGLLGTNLLGGKYWSSPSSLKGRKERANVIVTIAAEIRARISRRKKE